MEARKAGYITSGSTIVLNNLAVAIGWSLGIQHFSLGLYGALIGKAPGIKWRLLVPRGQKSKYKAHLRAINVSYCYEQEATTVRRLRRICQRLGLNRYGFPPISGRLGVGSFRSSEAKTVQNTWLNILERKACLEYCPSQVTPVHTKLPLVLTCHDLHPWNVPWQYPDPEGLKSIVINNLRRAKAIVVSWPHPFKEVAERFPEYHTKMFMVPFPVVMDLRTPDSKEAKYLRAHFKLYGRFLLYPARLQPHKNHRTLLSAFAAARKTLGEVHLVCPGSAWTEEYRQELLYLSEALGLINHVHFPGYVSNEDLQGLYALCDAIVAPTLAEATSGAMVEGFAYGKPVACSDILPLKMFVKWVDGHACFFEPTSAQSMARAIVEIMENPEPYRIGSSQAGERLRELNWSQTSEQYIDVFKWVLNGSKTEARPEWANQPFEFQL